MSRNIVFEGWLTKSPPSKRIWRTKWRRRWFALRQSGELPGQYFLDYYEDRNCRRLKGTINLDLCEQVDAGLHMERAGNGTLDPKLRGSVFTIQTQSRTYHLEADCEADMAKWVDAICRACGLRPAEDDCSPSDAYVVTSNVTPAHANSDNAITTGPYIPISECITGVRAQDQQRTFTFDRANIVMCDKSTETSGPYVAPDIKITGVESENESNLSDEDCRSLNASQANMPHWSVGKSFTKLAISPNGKSPNGHSSNTFLSPNTAYSEDRRSLNTKPSNANSSYTDEIYEEGPPVPPRPPKTLPKKRILVQKESYQGPKVPKPVDPVQESIANYTGPGTPWLRIPHRPQGTGRRSPSRIHKRPSFNLLPTTDEEDEGGPEVTSMQYYNLPSLPPAVDRALKPQYSNQSFGHINNYTVQGEEMKPESLQYLDLDFSDTKASSFNSSSYPRRFDIIHGKSYSDVEVEYKTVDFIKTEAFNITRQDAEAFRSYQC